MQAHGSPVGQRQNRYRAVHEYGAVQDRTSRTNSAEMSVKQNSAEVKVGTTDVEKQKENEENGTASAERKAETEAGKGKGKGRAGEAKLPCRVKTEVGRDELLSHSCMDEWALPAVGTVSRGHF